VVAEISVRERGWQVKGSLLEGSGRSLVLKIDEFKVGRVGLEASTCIASDANRSREGGLEPGGSRGGSTGILAPRELAIVGITSTAPAVGMQA
jgi:hypothetical protein